jgi:hypothetical protein
MIRRLLPVLLVFAFATSASAGQLKDETLAAWTSYITAKHNQPLKLSPMQRDEAQGGRIIVWPVAEVNPVKVPHGLIHDWAGVMYVPGVTMADVLATVRGGFFNPAIVKAKETDSTGVIDHYSILSVTHTTFTTAAVQGEYEAIYIQIDPAHGYSISQSTKLQAVENYGMPDEQLDPPDQGPGYVWRLYTISSYEETDGGVYVGIEAVGLSRDVPFWLRWIVNPIISHLPEDSLRATLAAMQAAVQKREAPHPIP